MSTSASAGSRLGVTGIAICMLFFFFMLIFGGPLAPIGLVGFVAAGMVLARHAGRTTKAARIGAVTGGISIAFSAICFFIFPVFTPAFVAALIVGAVCGGTALSLKAKRTALVAFVFALTPLCFHFLVDYAPARLHSNYAVIAALAIAVIVAVFALVDYARARRVPGNITT